MNSGPLSYRTSTNLFVCSNNESRCMYEYKMKTSWQLQKMTLKEVKTDPIKNSKPITRLQNRYRNRFDDAAAYYPHKVQTFVALKLPNGIDAYFGFRLLCWYLREWKLLWIETYIFRFRSVFTREKKNINSNFWFQKLVE